MFFIGIMGIDSTVKPLGEAPAECCPACGRGGRMSLAKGYSYFHFFFIPLFRWNKRYIATCPSCASVLEVNPETGGRLERHEASALYPADLALMRDNSVGLCPGCGCHNPAGSRYCNRCGKPL